MITQLSILIPVYNSCCVKMVTQLQSLCEAIIQPFDYEIIVADDGSTDIQALQNNQEINTLPHSSFIKKEKNTGSASTRNFLATHSHYPWLLFLDSDMTIPDKHFIQRYLAETRYDVVNGGIRIGKASRQNLRYLYEKQGESKHVVEKRNRMGFREFRSTNFLIRHALIAQVPFDERFTKSGYEDVHYGRTLSLQGATILHIDNPLVLDDFEDNPTYLLKCERNWCTLYRFRDELQGFSRLLTLCQRLAPFAHLIRLWHRLFGAVERRHLTGRHPTLFIFNLYRIGYYISIKL